MSEEWGPWIRHDGRGCPVPAGTVIQAVFELEPGEFSEPEVGVAKGAGAYSWDWRWWRRMAPDGSGLVARVVRYRVRKPRALSQLRELVETLPAPEREVA